MRGRLNGLQNYHKLRSNYFPDPHAANIYHNSECHANEVMPLVDPIECFELITGESVIAAELQDLFGKINNIEKKTGDIANDFKASALKHLKNGKNTLTVTSRHNWRWGMLFMKVYNDGFDFNLDARVVERK